jgi:hypothetical protein
VIATIAASADHAGLPGSEKVALSVVLGIGPTQPCRGRRAGLVSTKLNSTSR